jgi:glutamate synthase (NADPH/NADH) small chain
MNAQVMTGRWQAALATLVDTNPFAEFTARVCPALCEGACVQGKSEAPVPCRQIEMEIIERGFARGLVRARTPVRRRDLTVAVIGSGPAGLSAAWLLNQHGFRVTVYEKDARPGGFLRYGIPDFKLEKSAIDRRIAILEEEGITFECGVEAGLDVSQRLLCQRYDIVVLATGARQKRDLAIPGRNLAGVYFAVDYLSAQNRLNSGEIKHLPPEFDARGRHVVVIGGGDTGADCVGTANRQGAVFVSQFEIMPQPPECRAENNPWPEWPRVLRTSSSHEEGCERRWNISSLEFLPAEGNPDHVGGIQCEEVRWEEADGRLVKPVPVPDTGFVKKADLVLLAMGFTGVEPGPLLDDLGLTPERGRLPRDASGRVAEGVYACGDSANGPSLVVKAMSDGLEVAKTVLADYGGAVC